MRRYRFHALALILGLSVALLLPPGPSATTSRASQNATLVPAFAGFDLNEYPGDDSLDALKQTFSYAGYWLSPPPGAKSTNWLGTREKLAAHGFGFAVLYTGRATRNLKNLADAQRKGALDGETA